MPIRYLQAFEALDAVAQELSAVVVQDEEKVALMASVGRIGARQIKSPCFIPAFDTSAMDGYALDSSLTSCASTEAPVYFRLSGTVAAGDGPITLQSPKGNTLPCCSEIMTGAQFPYNLDGRQLDACMPVELAQLVNMNDKLDPCLKIISPVRENQHRRFAGSDIAKHQVLLERGELVTAQHIMTLSTLGFAEIDVARRLQVGVCSTGSEVVSFNSKECSSHQIRDSNSPYIRQVLHESGAMVTHFKPVPDEMTALRSMLQEFLSDENDILITTGGVSAGKFDMVRESIEDLGATVHFHKVAIKPGHPILFGTFNHAQTMQSLHSGVRKPEKKVFFGLPGNPIATAACLQFFVIPFLERLRGEPYLPPIHARVKDFKQGAPTCNGAGRPQQNRAVDVFQHGHLQLGKNGWEVITNQDQASYKVSPIARSNSWVWFPYHQDEATHEGLLPCFPFSPFNRSFRPSPTPLTHTLLENTTRAGFSVTSSKSSQMKILILAGGLSTRMKMPKHLLRLRDDRLAYEILLEEIQKVVPTIQSRDIYLSLRNCDQVSELKHGHFVRNYNVLPCKTITDDVATTTLSLHEDIGPATGLLSAYVTDSTNDWLVIACDFPLLNSSCLTQILDEHNDATGESNVKSPSVTCFVNKDGFYEPLLAVWTAAGLERLKQNVLDGVNGPSRTIEDLVKLGRVHSVAPDEENWILNANTPAELEACLACRVTS